MFVLLTETPLCWNSCEHCATGFFQYLRLNSCVYLMCRSVLLTTLWCFRRFSRNNALDDFSGRPFRAKSHPR